MIYGLTEKVCLLAVNDDDDDDDEIDSDIDIEAFEELNAAETTNTTTNEKMTSPDIWTQDYFLKSQSDFISAINNLYRNNHLRCFIHTLQLVINDCKFLFYFD